jgi:hypothetical protein
MKKCRGNNGKRIWKKKAKKTDFGNFYRTPEEEFEAMRWCLKNNIVVAPLAAEKGKTNPQYFILIL